MFIESEKCPNCEQPAEWLIDCCRGDYICSGCGLVAPDRVIDHSLEKRNFSTSTTDHNRGELQKAFMSSMSSTVIGSSKRQKTSKIQKAHSIINKSSTLVDQHLEKFFVPIHNFSIALQLEKVISDKAKEILYSFEKASIGSKKILNAEAGALAAIHLACGQLHTGRTLNSLYMDLKQAGFDVDETKAMAARSSIVKRVPGVNVQTQSNDVITNICQTMQLSQLVIHVAQIIREKSQPYIEGKTPSTISAGSIFLACEMLRETFDVTSLLAVANVAKTTLDKYCREVTKKVAVLIDPIEFEKIIKEHKKKL